jgi:hypothetical protein
MLHSRLCYVKYHMEELRAVLHSNQVSCYHVYLSTITLSNITSSNITLSNITSTLSQWDPR